MSVAAAEDGAVGLLHGVDEVVRRAEVVVTGERAQRHRRGHLAGPVPAHAVGHRDQELRGQRTVLVHRPDPADVGDGRCPQGRHASSSTVEPTCSRSPGADQHRARHLGPVEVGAVGGAEVLDVDLAAAHEDAGVDLRHVGVVESHLAAGRPPHRQLLAERVEPALLLGRCHDDQGRAVGATVATPAGAAPCGRRRRRWGGVAGRSAGGAGGGQLRGGAWPRPVDLDPDRPDDPQEEQVEQRQQAELEDREQLLGHGMVRYVSSTEGLV